MQIENCKMVVVLSVTLQFAFFNFQFSIERTVPLSSPLRFARFFGVHFQCPTPSSSSAPPAT